MKKYEIANVGEARLTIDVSALVKSDTMYFNATEMAKCFGKKAKDYLKTEITQQYIKSLKEYINDENFQPFIVKRGKYGGTWIHSYLLNSFAEWLKPGFSLRIQEWLYNSYGSRMAKFLTPRPLKKYLYVAGTFCGFTKVGITNTPKIRKRQIECSSGRKITHFVIFECRGYAEHYEQVTLSHFDKERLIGEWLDINWEIVATWVSDYIARSKEHITSLVEDESVADIEKIKILREYQDALEIMDEDQTNIKDKLVCLNKKLDEILEGKAFDEKFQLMLKKLKEKEEI